MESLSTPIPLPKLNILKASDLIDKKSSLKKQLLLGTRTCPHGPSKNPCRLLFLSPESPAVKKTGRRTHASFTTKSKLIRSPTYGIINDLSTSSDDSPPTPSINDNRHGPGSWSLSDPRLSCQTPRLISFASKTDDGVRDAEDEPKYDDVIRGVKFELIEKLGSGSFGEVYKVREASSRKLFAVKKSRERFRGANDRKRKLEEVRKMQTMGPHENCVRFFRAWEENLFLFIQTELCHTTLSKLISETEDQHIEEEETWLILGDMLQALTHLSTRNLVHLDIKPANIFLGIPEPHVYKLGDFGLMIDTTDELIDTQEGDPKYLALEVLSEVYTSAADIFSLGATLLDCATSIDLPRSGHWWQLLRDSLLNLPNEFLKEMSPELALVLECMMSKDYSSRPSAEQLLSDPEVLHKTSTATRKRRDHLKSWQDILLDLGASPMKRIRLDSSSSSCGETSSPKREKPPIAFFRPEKETQTNPKVASLHKEATAELKSSTVVVSEERTADMVFSDERDFTLSFPLQSDQNVEVHFGDHQLLPYSNFSSLVRPSTSTVCSSSGDDSGIAGHSTDKCHSQSEATEDSSPEQESSPALVSPFSPSSTDSRPKNEENVCSPSAAVTPTTSPRLRSGSKASPEGFYTPSHSFQIVNSNSSSNRLVSTALPFGERSPRKCSSSSSESVGGFSELFSDDDVRTCNYANSDAFETEDDVFTSSNLMSTTSKVGDWSPSSLSAAAENEIIEGPSPIITPPVQTSASKKRSANAMNFQSQSSNSQFQPIVFESLNF